MWFRRRPPASTPVPRIREPSIPPTSVRPVLLPPTEAGYLAARGLDAQVRATVQPDTLWEGSVPGYTAAQAVHTLATLRADTARLQVLDPAAVAAAGSAAALASGALRAVLLLSGRTTYDAMRDDRSYVAYDMTRRLRLLAESVGEPRDWSGATSRALWSGLVAEWAGLRVGPDEAEGLASLAPLIENLNGLRPLPGAEAAGVALGLVEPVLVAAVQRALRWAVVAAVALLRPDSEPRSLDAQLPRAVGPVVMPLRSAVEQLRAHDPLVVQHYDALRTVEGELADEVGPSKRASGHMDVRPDEAVVQGLQWRSAAATAAVTLLGRRQLAGRDGPWRPLAGLAYDLLETVSANGACWPDDGVRSLRRAVDLALVLTVSGRP